jgi:hypothetical protein
MPTSTCPPQASMTQKPSEGCRDLPTSSVSLTPDFSLLYPCIIKAPPRCLSWLILLLISHVLSLPACECPASGCPSMLHAYPILVWFQLVLNDTIPYLQRSSSTFCASSASPRLRWLLSLPLSFTSTCGSPPYLPLSIYSRKFCALAFHISLTSRRFAGYCRLAHGKGIRQPRRLEHRRGSQHRL